MWFYTQWTGKGTWWISMPRSSQNGQGRQVGPFSTSLIWKDQCGRYCSHWDTDYLWALALWLPVIPFVHSSLPPGHWPSGVPGKDRAIWSHHSPVASSIKRHGNVTGTARQPERQDHFYMAQLQCQRWESESVRSITSSSWLDFHYRVAKGTG